MDYKEISKISEQFSAGNWPRFIERIKITGLRGWNDNTIEFRFPIVAIVGENGSGKSTLLKSLACAYEGNKKQTTFFPADFFIDTQWEKIQNARIEYEIKYGHKNSLKKIEPAFSKKTSRWNKIKDDRPKNDVFLLEISRTVPLDATAGYAKIAKLAAKEVSRSEIKPEYRKKLSHILGREYTNASFAMTEMDNKRDVGLLRRSFGEVSQYHQGAGEDTMLDLIRQLQDLPNYSLLIIDEVEASLHPKSQRRLIQFLLWFCREKRCQIVLSTHSPYILQELPKEARIMLLHGTVGINVVTEITPEFAMSKLDDVVYPELELIIEDDDAGIWLREIIAYLDTEDAILPRIRSIPVGPANVVQIMGKLAHENRLPYKSLAILDGDKPATAGCTNMPGMHAPEYVVFEGLKQLKWVNLDNRFGIGAGTLFQILDDVMLAPDHHKWTTMVGDKIKLGSRSVWQIMCNEWCKHKECLQEDYIQNLKQLLEDKLKK